MDIKNKLFKIKRTLYKNRELIGRVISISLTVVLVVAVAYGAYTIYQADKVREIEANQPIDERKIELPKKWDYGKEGFNKVAESDSLTLEADYTTGEIRITEKKSGKQWFSNPPDRKETNDLPYLVNSQISVTWLNADGFARIEGKGYNYNESIRKGGMSYELVENGIKFKFAYPNANVYIPVQYTLVDDAFQAEIVTSEIERVGSKAWYPVSVELLPFFGAGGKKDDGYLFVPDGSGSLIKYNNNKQSSQSYSASVYGDNPTMGKEKLDTVKEQIVMPVFGAKTNDNAFLGVIVSGEANSSISASTSAKTSSYNTVYSTALLREYTLTFERGGVFAQKDTKMLQMSDDLTSGKNYAVRYFFLEGEKANYTGMSECYRDFLKDTDQLKDSPLSDKKYLVLDLVGAVSIEQYVFGIKKPVVTPLTTYNDVITIVTELKAEGVDNIILNYKGALNGGLNNMMYSKVSAESVLGSKKDFEKMITFLKEQNVVFFLESNPVDIYNNGNGYDDNRDTTKSFYNKYAFQYNFKLDSLKPLTDRWHLLYSPLVPDFAAKFAASAAEWDITNVSFDRLGQVLYSDFRDNEPTVSRQHTLDLWKQAMQNADEKAEYLMLHTGNAYTSAYSDVVTDTANSASDFDMTDLSIPFYQLVFQDNKVITSNAINTTVDYTEAMLKAIESGSNLKFNLIYADVATLVGTEYNTMVSYSYAYWKDIIVEQYKTLQAASAQFAGQEVLSHTMVEDDVTLTEYAAGKILVNYRDQAYTYNGAKVEARSYLVLTGGAK